MTPCQDPWKRPTKANILTTMKWLVDGAQPGDSLFFHYSGHGSQGKHTLLFAISDAYTLGTVRDADGDEEDGLDETICMLHFM